MDVLGDLGSYLTRARLFLFEDEGSFADLVRDGISLSGVSVEQMAELLEVAPFAVTRWIEGKVEPSERVQRSIVRELRWMVTAEETLRRGIVVVPKEKEGPLRDRVKWPSVRETAEKRAGELGITVEEFLKREQKRVREITAAAIGDSSCPEEDE
jgi:hypothetical protein